MKFSLASALALFLPGISLWAGNGDIEAKLITIEKPKDGGPDFAVREDNKISVKVKNNGPDEVGIAVKVWVYPGRVEAQGKPLYEKVSKVDKVAVGVIVDIEFAGIAIAEEGSYLIKAVVAPLPEHEDTTADNNEVIRRPARARVFTPKK